MQLIQNVIKSLPFPLQKRALQILFKKNKVVLEDFLVEGNSKKIYLYKIDGVYIPREQIIWFLKYSDYVQFVCDHSAAFYQPKAGDVVIDIGAGIGEEAIVFAKMTGNSGHVYSIEANPEISKILKRVIDKNELAQVTVSNIAINVTNEPVMIHANDDFIKGSIAQNGAKDNQAFEVTGQRFDSYLKEHNIDKIDLLKVNIEGAERFVIETMGDTLRKIKHVAIACHDFRYHNEGNEFFRTKKLVTDFLEANDFSVQTLHTGIPHRDDYVFGANNNYAG